MNKAEGRGDKGPKLEIPKATLASAKVRLDEAKSALLSAERSATKESPMTAPVWLLPAALDLIIASSSKSNAVNKCSQDGLRFRRLPALQRMTARLVAIARMTEIVIPPSADLPAGL